MSCCSRAVTPLTCLVAETILYVHASVHAHRLIVQAKGPFHAILVQLFFAVCNDRLNHVLWVAHKLALSDLLVVDEKAQSAIYKLSLLPLLCLDLVVCYWVDEDWTTDPPNGFFSFWGFDSHLSTYAIGLQKRAYRHATRSLRWSSVWCRAGLAS